MDRGGRARAALRATPRRRARAPGPGTRRARGPVRAGKRRALGTVGARAGRPDRGASQLPSATPSLAMQIQNSVFLVAGGGSGLGAATAQMLASQGGKVVIADLNE